MRNLIWPARLPCGHDGPRRRRWRTKAPTTIRADGVATAGSVIKRPRRAGKTRGGKARISTHPAEGGSH